MRVIKAIASVFVFSALGIGLGAGLFYFQQNMSTKAVATEKTSKSTQPSTIDSSTTLAKFTSPATNIAFTLPENTVVLETSITDLSSQIDGTVQVLYTLDKSTNVLTDTGVQVSTLSNNGATTNAFATAGKKMETQRSTGKLLKQTLESSTTSGLAVTQKNYMSTGGGSDVLSIISEDDLYILVYIPSTTVLTEQTLSDFLASILITNAPSATPSALLNSPQ